MKSNWSLKSITDHPSVVPLGFMEIDFESIVDVKNEYTTVEMKKNNQWKKDSNQKKHLCSPKAN